MIANRSKPPGPVTPVLVYEDIGKAIDWLCDTFGFTEHFRYGREGKVEGASLNVGQGSVMLSSARVGHGPHDNTEFRAPRPDELDHSVMVHVEDVDAHHERAKQRGARILLEPATHPFGERQYSAKDFAGHLWAFSESVADVAPEEWGGTTPG
jgi:uncharacterized glyoxalase superfamily protein PhnB